MELTVDPADFTRLVERNVLAVDGEPYLELDDFKRKYIDGDTSIENQVGPPADLLALVGKVCEGCERGLVGDPAERCNCGYGGFHEPLNPRCDRNVPHPNCHGTGFELLTVVVECVCWAGDQSHYNAGPLNRCRICDDIGTRSLLVRLTGQPVQQDDGRWHFPCEVVR